MGIYTDERQLDKAKGVEMLPSLSGASSLALTPVPFVPPMSLKGQSEEWDKNRDCIAGELVTRYPGTKKPLMSSADTKGLKVEATGRQLNFSLRAFAVGNLHCLVGCIHRQMCDSLALCE